MTLLPDPGKRRRSTAATARGQTMLRDERPASLPGSGSATERGQDIHKALIACCAVHLLLDERLSWIDGSLPDIPVSISAETDGAGDDIGLMLHGQVEVEIQVKGGLKRGARLWTSLARMIDALRESPDLFSVLVVDEFSSRTVRYHLERDIRRIAEGRFDGIHPIATALLTRTSLSPSQAQPLFKRLRIREMPGLHDRDSPPGIRGMLRLLSADDATAHRIWVELYKDAATLIDLRGSRDKAQLVHLLQRNGLWRHTSRGDSRAEVHYRQWAATIYGSFTIPGLGVRLPIEKASFPIRLGAASSDVETRASGTPSLATAEDSDEADYGRDDLDLGHLVHFAKRTLFVGAGGSGKTTLLRRVAHRWSTTDELCILVRLPLVARRMLQRSELFEEAMNSVAFDGFPEPRANHESLLSSAALLLLDGLDDCGPARKLITEGIQQWAAGHPSCRLVVTARTDAFDPAFFRDWLQVRARPFAKGKLTAHLTTLLQHVYPEPERAAEEARVLAVRINADVSSSLALRTPLLLGLLAALHVHGVTATGSRDAIYERVISLLLSQDVDRSHRWPIDEPTAQLGINLIAWALQTGVNGRALANCVSQALTAALRITPLQGSRLTDRLLAYLTDKQLLQRFELPGDFIFAFVHQRFQEYGSARYLHSLDRSSIQALTKQWSRDPDWREVFVLAGLLDDRQEILDCLLDSQDSSLAIATEVLVATQIAAEASYHVSCAALQKLAQQLKQRIESDSPLIAFETAKSAVALARQFPEICGEVFRNSSSKHLPWAQRCLLAVSLAARDDGLSVEPVRDALMKTSHWSRLARHDDPTVCRAVDSVLLSDGVRFLLKKAPGPDLDKDILALLQSLSIANYKTLRRTLAEEDRYDLLSTNTEWMRQRHSPLAFDWLNRPEWQAADRALLDAIKSATATSSPLKSVSPPFLALSAIFHAMQFPETTAYTVLQHRRAEDVVRCVVGGTIAALDLRRERVAAEAASALRLLAEDSSTTLYEWLPPLCIDPTWANAKDLDANLLLQALEHPCEAIAVTGAELLCARQGDMRVAEMIRQFLRTANGNSLWYLAMLAKPLWGIGADIALLERLEGDINDGVQHLVPTLLNVCRVENQRRASEAIARVLSSGNRRVVMDTAQALTPGGASGDVATLSNEVLSALERWAEPPVAPQGSSFLPPDPLPALVRYAGGSRILDRPALLAYGSQERTRDAALEALVSLAVTDAGKSALIEDLTEGRVSSRAIRFLAKLEQGVRSLQVTDVTKLLQSRTPSVRLEALRHLVGPWFVPSDCEALVRLAITDTEPAVRDAAVVALRRVDVQKNRQQQLPPTELMTSTHSMVLN